MANTQTYKVIDDTWAPHVASETRDVTVISLAEGNGAAARLVRPSGPNSSYRVAVDRSGRASTIELEIPKEAAQGLLGDLNREFRDTFPLDSGFTADLEHAVDGSELVLTGRFRQSRAEPIRIAVDQGVAQAFLEDKDGFPNRLMKSTRAITVESDDPRVETITGQLDSYHGREDVVVHLELPSGAPKPDLEWLGTPTTHRPSIAEVANIHSFEVTDDGWTSYVSSEPRDVAIVSLAEGNGAAAQLLRPDGRHSSYRVAVDRRGSASTVEVEITDEAAQNLLGDPDREFRERFPLDSGFTAQLEDSNDGPALVLTGNFRGANTDPVRIAVDRTVAQAYFADHANFPDRLMLSTRSITIENDDPDVEPITGQLDSYHGREDVVVHLELPNGAPKPDLKWLGGPTAHRPSIANTADRGSLA